MRRSAALGSVAIVAVLLVAWLAVRGAHEGAIVPGEAASRTSEHTPPGPGVGPQGEEGPGDSSSSHGTQPVRLVVSAWVVGKVADTRGVPQAGARLELEEARGETDADGRFRLPAHGGPGTLRVSQPGFLSLEVEVGSGARDLGTLVLRRVGLVVEGLVLDPSGVPVADCVVEARPAPRIGTVPLDQQLDQVLRSAPGPSRPLGSARTDPLGRFRIELEERAAALAIEARCDLGAGGVSAEPDERESVCRVAIELVAVATVRGRVVGADGEGVGSLSVAIAPYSAASGAAGASWRREAITDHQGRFSVGDVPAVPSVVAVRAPHGGHELVRFEFPLEAELLVTLEATCGFDGIVRDARTREPIEGARVSAWTERSDGARASWGEGLSGADGRFQVVGLPPGEVRVVVVRHAEYAPAGTPIPFSLPRSPRAGPAGSPSEPFEILLNRGLEAVAQVYEPGGSPADGAVVELEAHGGLIRASAPCDASGTARIRGIPAGFYRVEVRSPAGVLPVVASTITLEPGQGPLRLDLVEPIRVRGEVVTAADAPLEGALVRMTIVAAAGTGVLRESTATTDQRGAFQFALVPPECSFEVAVSAPRHAGAEISGRAELGLRQIDLGRIRLERVLELRGRILDGDGAPVAGASVNLVRGASAASAAAWSGSDGTFTLERLEPGPVRIVVTAPAHPPWIGPTLELAPGDGLRTLEVRLADGATRRGRVVDAEGRLVEGAEVVAEWALLGRELEDDAQALLPQLLRFCRSHARTDSSGEFVLSGLPGERPFRVSASGGGHGIGEEIVQPDGRVHEEWIEIRVPGEEMR